MAVAWDNLDVQLTGTINPSSNMITGINSATLNNYVLTYGLGTGMPVIASGVLTTGTAIESYVIGAGVNDSTITLTENSLSSIAPNTTTTFTVDTAGPVGVQALRDLVTGTGSGSLINFLQQQIAAGNNQARPFLESGAPFLLSGPAPIFGVVPSLGPIQVSTAGSGILNQGDLVQISGVLGNTVANGVYAIDTASSSSFTIDYPISNGVYTSGGNWSVVAPSVVTGAAASPAVISTASVSGLSNGDAVTVSGVLGNTAVNGTFAATNVNTTLNTFTLGGPIGNGDYVANTGYWTLPNAPTTAITGATAGSQIVINTPNTVGLAANDMVLISGVNGVSGANGVFTVSDITATSFTLTNTAGTGTYVSGGTWEVVQPITGATNDSNPIVIATTTPGLLNGTVVEIGGVQGNTAANGLFVMQGVSGTGFTLSGPAGSGVYTPGSGNWSGANGGSGSVTGATRGGEVQITTSNAITVINGDTVVVSGVAGNTAANGSFTVSNVTSSTFTLAGSITNGPYTSGGIFYEPATTTAITNVTGSGAAQITVATGSTTGLNNGDTVLISGVGGNTAANGLFVVESLNVTPNTFMLGGPVGNGNYDDNSWSLAVTGASTTSAVISTGATTGLVNGDVVTIANAVGNTTINGQFVAANVTPTTFELGGPLGSGAYTSGGFWTLPNATTTPITGASNATVTGPIVIATTNTSGLAVNDIVFISGMQGMSGANGVSLVTAVTEDSFTLDDSLGVGTYTGGGSWQVVQTVTGATNDMNPIVIATGDTAGLNVGGVVNVQWVGGNSAANGQFVVTSITPNTSFTLGSPAGGGAYTSGGNWTSTGGSGSVTGATNGGQIVVTATQLNGLQNGDLVEVTGVLGNTAANGVYYISNVTPTSFMLDGALGSGTYSFGGTWKEYTSLTRLVSPKDLVESLGNPADTSSLNNYFNELIDEFFLQYLPSTEMVGGQSGGGQILELQSSASGSLVTYNGYVTNVGTQNGGYVLRFESGGTGIDSLDIYYPFFTTNAPAADVYTPLFPIAAPPTWITNLGSENESASQMLFACDAVFADNTARTALGMSAAQATIVADLENMVSGAFNRGIALNPGDTWSDSTQWFPAGGTYNYWVEYWHQTGLTFNDLAYAFAYDDKFGASTNLDASNVGLTQITLGSWSSSRTPSSVALQTTASAAVAQNSSVTLTATITGFNGDADRLGRVFRQRHCHQLEQRQQYGADRVCQRRRQAGQRRHGDIDGRSALAARRQLHVQCYCNLPG